MAGTRRGALGLLFLTAIGAVTGCLSSNPSYFPYLFSPGEVTKTHAKPPGHGYYANFDPYACRIEVRPLNSSQPVGNQHVLIATVYDAAGQPRRGRRVEWMLDGVGHIVEVDESGWDSARGYKNDNRYGVSYTAYKEHVVTRGNSDPNDDFTIRPGQTWCVVSSPVEGDTQVTAYAPEIHNWDRHHVTAVVHWLNANWKWPENAANRVGSQHAFTTNVFRNSDRQPIPGYVVRYTVAEGPPARFLESNRPVAEVTTDNLGNATATLAQDQPAAGINRIEIEIIRPPDPLQPLAGRLDIGRHQVFKEWVAPQVAINKAGPTLAGVGQPIIYTIAVTNTGTVPAEGVQVQDVLPPGMVFVNSQPPPGNPAPGPGEAVVWTPDVIAPGQTKTISLTARADAAGTYTNRAILSAPQDPSIRGESSFTTQVAQPGLTVTVTGPPTGQVGRPASFPISVANTGATPLTNVAVRAGFDAALVHQSGVTAVELPLGTLNPGETRPVQPLVLTPQQEGTFQLQVIASADGGVTDSKTVAIAVTQPQVGLSQTGPQVTFLKSSVNPTWTIRVENPGAAALTNVQIREVLPPQLAFVSATDGGQAGGAGEVLWNLGTMAPGQVKTVQIVARPVTLEPRAPLSATVTADGVVARKADAFVDIQGVPGLDLEVVPLKGAQVVVGEQKVYQILIRNRGTLARQGVGVIVTVPPQNLAVTAFDGPRTIQARNDNGRVTFTPANVGPNEELTYQIEVRALQPGDVRLRAEVSAPGLPNPVLKEAATTVLPAQPGQAEAPAAPPNRPVVPAEPPAGAPPPMPPGGM